MLRKTLLFIIFPILAIIVAVTLTAHLFSSPAKFSVVNTTPEPVKVAARWRDKTRNIGQIPPNTSTEFFVEDEAVMTFEITRANGTGLTIGNIDFAADITTRVEIGRTSVEVKTNTE